MYDFIKLVTTSFKTQNTLLNHPDLNFCFDFVLYSSGRIIISGSLHKFYNFKIKGLESNYDSFTYSDAVKAMLLLCEEFELDPNATTVHNLEIGVNLTLSQLRVNDVLDNLLVYKNKAFNEMRITTGRRKGVDVYFGQYGLKAYNKSLQYNLDTEVIRIELKYIKMESIKEVRRSSDLFFYELWSKLKDRLLKVIDEIDCDFEFDKFKQKDIIEILSYKNPRSWEKFDRRKRYSFRAKFERYRRKGRLL